MPHCWRPPRAPRRVGPAAAAAALAHTDHHVSLQNGVTMVQAPWVLLYHVGLLYPMCRTCHPAAADAVYCCVEDVHEPTIETCIHAYLQRASFEFEFNYVSYLFEFRLYVKGRAMCVCDAD